MSNSKIALALYGIGVFTLGMVVALAGEHLLFNRPDPRDSWSINKKIQDWQIACSARTDKDGGCVLETAIIDKATNAPVMQLTVKQKGENDILTIVIVPLGILIPPGLRISAGAGQPRAAPYETCVQGGCVASLLMDSGLSSAMILNTTGQVVVVNGAGKAVALNYSLKGFADAVAARAVEMKARSVH